MMRSFDMSYCSNEQLTYILFVRSAQPKCTRNERQVCLQHGRLQLCLHTTRRMRMAEKLPTGRGASATKQFQKQSFEA